MTQLMPILLLGECGDLCNRRHSVRLRVGATPADANNTGVIRFSGML